MSNNYKVTLRDHSTREHTADNVHVTSQGNVKLLNGKGHAAELVAFYNTADVVSVEKINAA